MACCFIRCCQSQCCPKRNWIVFIIFLTTFINYTTRANLPMSLPAMTLRRKDHAIAECIVIINFNNSHSDAFDTDEQLDDYGPRFKWGETTQGMILGSYFWGHVVGSLPSGFIAEWFGPFWTIFIAETITAIFNSLCVLAAGYHYAALIGCRFIMGIMGGLIYPSLHVLIARWAPPDEKGKFTGGLMGSNLSTCLTWLTVGYVTHSVNWYWGYHVVTVEIIVFLVLFFFIGSDSPENHACITQEEREYIQSSQAGIISSKKRFPPIKAILLSIPFWALVIGVFGNLYGLYFQLTEVPKFLHEVIGFRFATASLWASTTQIARTVTGLLFGWFADYLVKSKIMSTKVLRKSFTILSHIIPGVLLMLMWLAECSAPWAIALLTLGLAFNGASCVTVLINPQDLSPNFAGSLFGIVMMLGATSGFIAPLVTSSLIHKHSGINEWGWNFVLAGSIYASFGIIFLIFGSTEIQPWNEKKNKEEQA